jgi:two-component system phosphate regulon sensor histidine kinase PhoR
MSKDKEASTEFLSLASHQMKNYVSSIKWYCELVLSGDLGPVTKDQENSLEKIQGANSKMLDLVKSLLDISKVKNSQFTSGIENLSLHKLVAEIISELQVDIIQKLHHMDVNIDPELKTIESDKKALRIILKNVLSNAINYTPQEGNISFLVHTKDKGSVEFIIKDNGVGIPENEKDKVFNKLYRADNVREKFDEGVGLGLYIVKLLTEELKGNIRFESKLEKGTTFYIEIPQKL